MPKGVYKHQQKSLVWKRLMKQKIKESWKNKNIRKKRINNIKKYWKLNRKPILKEIILCGCGCGKTLNKYDNRRRGRTYIQGHKSQEQRKKLAETQIGRKWLKKSLEKRTETRKKNGWNKNPELTKIRKSEAIKGHKHTNETKKLLSLQRKGKPLNPNVYSKEAIAKRSGIFNKRWKGGITPERIKFWKSEEHSNWRKAVFERDNYTCQ